MHNRFQQQTATFKKMCYPRKYCLVQTDGVHQLLGKTENQKEWLLLEM